MRAQYGRGKMGNSSNKTKRRELKPVKKAGQKGLIDIIKSKLPTPKDGHTPTHNELVALIEPLIPDPVKGVDGVDGHTPTTEELEALIKPLIPAPIVGARGKTGFRGEPGKDAEPVNYQAIYDNVKSFALKEIKARDDVHTKSINELRALFAKAITVTPRGLPPEIEIESSDETLIVNKTGPNSVDLSTGTQFRETRKGVEMRLKDGGKWGPWRIIDPNRRELLKTAASGGGGAGWSTAGKGANRFAEDLTVDNNGQTIFNLTKTPKNLETSELTINSGTYTYPDFYLFSGNSIVWLNAFEIETTDCLSIKYEV